jgi:hypothetical protein
MYRMFRLNERFGFYIKTLRNYFEIIPDNGNKLGHENYKIKNYTYHFSHHKYI